MQTHHSKYPKATKKIVNAFLGEAEIIEYIDEGDYLVAYGNELDQISIPAQYMRYLEDCKCLHARQQDCINFFGLSKCTS